MVPGGSSKRQRGGSGSDEAQGSEGVNVLRQFIECVEARRSAREQKIPPITSDPRRVEEPN